MEANRRTLRRALLVIAGLLVLLGAGASRQFQEGARAYAAFEAASAAGDLSSSLAWLRAAAEAVAPGSPYPARAYAELARVAGVAAAKRDTTTARAAWLAVRAAARETRGLGVATDGWEARADEALKELALATPVAVGLAAADAAPPAQAPLAKESPATASFVALAAAALFLAVGVTRLVWAGVPSLRRAPAAYAIAAAGLVLFGAAVALT